MQYYRVHSIWKEMMKKRNEFRVCVNLAITHSKYFIFIAFKRCEEKRLGNLFVIYAAASVFSSLFGFCLWIAWLWQRRWWCNNINKTQLMMNKVDVYEQTKLLPAREIQLIFICVWHTMCMVADHSSCEWSKKKYGEYMIWKCCWARQHSLYTLTVTVSVSVSVVFYGVCFVLFRLFVCLCVVLCSAWSLQQRVSRAKANARLTVSIDAQQSRVSKLLKNINYLLHGSSFVQPTTMFHLFARVFFSSILSFFYLHLWTHDASYYW